MEVLVCEKWGSKLSDEGISCGTLGLRERFN